MKRLIKPLYQYLHDKLNEVYRRSLTSFNGQPVLSGHVSDMHLHHPELDDQLEEQLKALGISVERHAIDIDAYWKYRETASYPSDYFGGGKDPKRNFTEKTLEHYLSTEFADFSKGGNLIDVAAATSPWSQIAAERYPGLKSWIQDLVFRPGVSGNRIGGFAHEIPLPDGTVDFITLHCSLEHFEGNSDRLFFKKVNSLLAPGGKLILHPFYIALTYTQHIDPAYNYFRRHKPILDDQAQLRIADWYQFYSRHYSPKAFQERIIEECPDLQVKVYRITNFREVDPTSYLRWVLVLEKPAK